MRSGLVVLWLALAACGAQRDTVSEASHAYPDVAPSDFALIDCGVERARGVCVVIAAGGKRVLVGAPGGLAASLGDNALAALDGVLLSGLSGAETEGLDEIRNRGWIAGRRAPLEVAGPAGVEMLVRGLNGAFQTADAIAQVRDAPLGGYGAALLISREGDDRSAWTAFDTGDFSITGLPGGPFEQAYLAVYDGFRLLILPCGVAPPADVAVDGVLSCEAIAGAAHFRWPLEEAVVFVTSATDDSGP